MHLYYRCHPNLLGSNSPRTKKHSRIYEIFQHSHKIFFLRVFSYFFLFFEMPFLEVTNLPFPSTIPKVFVFDCTYVYIINVITKQRVHVVAVESWGQTGRKYRYYLAIVAQMRCEMNLFEFSFYEKFLIDCYLYYHSSILTLTLTPYTNIKFSFCQRPYQSLSWLERE